ncbi:MAG TPA: LLM class flavin-dependent oxidoreductase [Actinocrinis sp.]|uniref:LLM class flavin-dependent oxidoreductase n=1 Tax=Actinocrinis sp. TaxID=1920516 RepID=UPI002D750BE6|nr:LLM class flavin-dependent oxidoreductase [Actinocrinis sp.]HZU56785.1 LLM class flavin-dependent oxidoreductase [Actinocrinis sp.]
MRVGAFLLAGQFPGQDHGTVLERTVAAAVAAEDAGFDDVWIAEHHFMTYGVCPSAITWAGYVLGRTRRIEVGTAVSVLSTVHPVAFGEQAALLDQLSGGRFRLGIGRGGPWVDLEVFGTGRERIEDEGFAASLDLLLRWLTRDSVAGDGGLFPFREVAVVPRPATRPRLPVVLACTSPRSAALAAARGLSMLLGMNISDSQKAELVADYTATAQRAGHDPDGARHVFAALAHVADTRQEALATLRAAMPPWLGPGLAGFQALDGQPRRYSDPLEYTELLCSLNPIGSPDECVAHLRRTQRRTGIDHAILMVDACGDRKATLANIARLGAEVLPHLQSSREASAGALDAAG